MTSPATTDKNLVEFVIVQCQDCRWEGNRMDAPENIIFTHSCPLCGGEVKEEKL